MIGPNTTMTTASSMFTAPPFPACPATAAVAESRAARRAKSGDRAAALVAQSIAQLSLRGFWCKLEKLAL